MYDGFLNRILDKVADLEDKCIFTIGDIFHPGFYRILEGEHANKIVIYSLVSKIDDKNILIFANSMTWIYKEKLDSVRCERAHPTFNSPKNKVDFSKSTWYADNGEGPFHHEW
jgi:hypothetical protein